MTAGGGRYASWGVRAAASLIDTLLLVAVALLLRLITIPVRRAVLPDGDELGRTLGAAEYIEDTKQVLTVIGTVNGLLLLVALVANAVVAQGLTGQSLGKRLVGIRLVDGDSSRSVGVGRALLRQFAHLADAVPCGIGYLWPIWDPRRQTFADKLTNTVVLPAGAGQPAEMRQAVDDPRSATPPVPTRTSPALPPQATTAGLPDVVPAQATTPGPVEAAPQQGASPERAGIAAPTAGAAAAATTLQRFVDAHGPLSESDVRALGARLAEALASRHGAGRAHGSLAPDTVGYRPAAPVLLDVPTAVPGYAAPDVAAGMPASPAGDVFGLGAVLVYAATGVGPFGSGAPQVLLERSLAEEPDLTWVPAAIRDPLRRCLAKDPAQRPAAAELAAILAPDAPLGAAEPVPPPAPAPVDRGVGADAAHGVLSKPAGLRSVRAQWLVLAAVVAVLVLIGGLLVARTGGGGQSEPPPGPPKTIVLPSELREVDRLAVDRQGTMWFFNSSSFTRGRGDGVWKRSADNGALSVVPGISPTGILSIASTSAGTLFVGANANELFLGPQPTTYSGILKVPDSAASMPVPVPTGHDVYPHAIAVNDSGDVYVASGGRVLKRLDSGSDSVVVQPVPGPSRLEDVAVNNLGDIVVVEEVDYRTYSVWKLPAGAAAATRMYGPVQDRVKDVAISDGGDVYAVLGGYPGGGVLRFPADGTPPVTVSGDHYAAAVVTKARDVYILQGNPNSVLELPNLSTPNAKRPKPSARSSTAWSPTYAETPSAPVNQTVAVPERGVTYEVPSNWRVAAQTTVGGVASHRGRLSGRGYAQFDRDCSTQEGPLSFIARSQQIADPRAAAVDFGRVGAEYGWEDTRDIRQSDATPFTTASGIQGWMVQTTGTTRPQEQCGVASYAVYSFGFAGPAGPLVAMIASGRGIPGAVTPETARQIFTTVR